MKYLFFLLSASIVLLQSCGGNDDLTELEQATLNATCYQDEGRKVVAVFEDVEAFIVNPSINNCNTGTGDNDGPYLIEDSFQPVPPEFGNFAACNLSTEFMTNKDTIAVTISGYAFEIFEVEILCAQFFEITEIRLSQNQ